VNSVRKVGGHKIRLNRPLRGIPKIFALSVTGAHQNTAGARAAGKFDIAVTIAHDERAMQVDGVLAGRSFKHSCLRLTAIACIRRSVRAIVYGVDVGAGGFEMLGHQLVHRTYKRFRKVAPANARLICHDNHGETGLVQTPDGVRDMRQDTKPADVIQVADFFGNGAIAI
jgi:hypothetical protein